MDFTVYRDETGFAALAPEWNELLGRSRTPTIFSTREWQLTWWQQLGQCRGPLYLLAGREGERLLCIIPLYGVAEPGCDVLRVVGCVEVADYLDLIIEAGQEEAVYAAFLEWLAGAGAPAWDCLELCNQPAASLAHSRLPELARARGWFAEVAQEDVCPVVALPPAGQGAGAAWEAYLESLDKKQRHEIRRKLRRLEREAPDSRFRVVTGGPDLDREVDCFIDLHRLSTRAKDDFMDEEMQAFFHSIARTAADAGWLHLSFLDIGGQPAASLFCFDYANEILVYNSGYDPQAYQQLSPGWVVLTQVIQNAIEMQRVRLDFLQGNEDYKYRFGGVDSPVYRTLVRKR